MKIFITKGKDAHFILEKGGLRFMVAKSIYPQNGNIWVSPLIGSEHVDETNALHFLSFFGYTPEQVWNETASREFSLLNGHWML